MIRFTTIFSLALSLTAADARADTFDMAPEFSVINLDGPTPMIHLSVQNVSGSPDPDQRVLAMTSPLPILEANGEVGCDMFRDVVSVELQFGNLFLTGPSWDLQLTGIAWDMSDPQEFPGIENDIDYSIVHELDVPEYGALVDFGLNPVNIVEHELMMFELDGNDRLDFLRSDNVIETTITMNVLAWCTDDDGDGVVPGLRSREVGVSIFYHADPNLTEQAYAGSPTDIKADEDEPLGVATGETTGGDDTRTTDDRTTTTTTTTTATRTSTSR